MESAIPIWSPRCIRPLPPYIVSRSSIANVGLICSLTACRIGRSFRNEFVWRPLQIGRVKGSIAVQSLVRCANGAPAARVTGWAIERETSIPKQLILVNAGGKVCGLARATEIGTNINSQYKLPKFAASGFLGYIPGYNPQTPYFVRSADDNRLSRETLRVTSSGPMAASN